MHGASLSEMGQSQCLVSSEPPRRHGPSPSVEVWQCEQFTAVPLVFLNPLFAGILTFRVCRIELRFICEAEFTQIITLFFSFT